MKMHEQLDYSGLFDTEAEQSVIGAILLNNAALDDITGTVTADDFFDEAHRVIFDALQTIIVGGGRADVLTTHSTLKRSGRDERAGGLHYLGQMANSVHFATNAKRYAEIVREHSLARRLLSAANDIQASVLTQDGKTSAQKLETAQNALQAVSESTVKDDGPMDAESAVTEALDHLMAIYEGNANGQYKTGLEELDKRLCDLAPGALAIVAGRPGMGKTSLALQIIDTVAKDDKPGQVVMFSLEMPRKQIVLRLTAKNGLCPLPLVLNPLDGGRDDYGNPRSANEDEWAQITAGTSKVSKMRLHIDERGGLRVQDIRARCNIIKRKHGLKMIVIDYIQLMQGEGQNRTQEVGSISRGLKTLAKEFNVPVVALSQLNRGVEQRADKRPLMSDLRESGDIEQDADLIMFCYRGEYYTPDDPSLRGKAEIIVSKQRNGEAGTTAHVAWLPKWAGFGNLSKEDLIASFASHQPSKPSQKSSRGFD